MYKGKTCTASWVAKAPLPDVVASEHVLLARLYQKEVPIALVHNAGIFASLSAYERVLGATLEGLSFRLPVVLSDIPAY